EAHRGYDIDRLALLLQGGDADRCRNLDALLALVHSEWLVGDRTAQPLGDHASDVEVGLGHHDHELLAAIAAGEIDAADRFAHAHRELAQHVIAGIMAV